MLSCCRSRSSSSIFIVSSQPSAFVALWPSWCQEHSRTNRSQHAQPDLAPVQRYLGAAVRWRMRSFRKGTKLSASLARAETRPPPYSQAPENEGLFPTWRSRVKNGYTPLFSRIGFQFFFSTSPCLLVFVVPDVCLEDSSQNIPGISRHDLSQYAFHSSPNSLPIKASSSLIRNKTRATNRQVKARPIHERKSMDRPIPWIIPPR